MRLFWTPEALDDRRAIYDYIEADNPLAAWNLDELFSEKVRNLIDHPGLGRIGRVTRTRELVSIKTTSWFTTPPMTRYGFCACSTLPCSGLLLIAEQLK